MGQLFLKIFFWFWLGTTCLLAVLAVGYLMVEPDVLVQWRIIGRKAMLSVGIQASNTYEREGASAAMAMLAQISLPHTTLETGAYFSNTVAIPQPDGTLGLKACS